MKPIHLLGVLLAASALQAQTLNQAAATASLSSGNYVVGQQGANSQVWQKVTQVINGQGNVTYQTNQAYVELSTGLNFWRNGRWNASKEEIDISPDGLSAAGTNCQHQIFFPGNIFNGQIRLILPGGQTLASDPIGLAYFDGSNSVLLAVTTNSTGAILPSGNQVIYTNAFAGLNADLLYTYTKAGAEQDVVLRAQPPDPVSLGLNPQTTRLQVLTEFFNPPQPSVTATSALTEAGNLEDDTLNFGTMQMGQGKAFLVGANSPLVGVDKRWLTIQGRQFLIEEVPIVSIAGAIDTLPPFAAQAGSETKPVVSKNLILPAQRLTYSAPKTTFLAKAMPPDRGLVLDYVTFNSNQTNYTFQGDTTYYISGSYYSSGTNTFEGGAVLKFATNGSIEIGSVPGPSPGLNWKAGAYRPVIFTAKDDNTVGESIGTGNPTGYYGNPMITLDSFSPGVPLTGLRMSYAQTAILFGSSSANIYDAQFINCQNGLNLAGATVFLGNALFANVGANFIYQGGSTLNAQNTTFSGSAFLATAPSHQTGSSLALTNCILANVTNLFSGVFYTTSANYNGFYNTAEWGSNPVTTNFYPFQAVGGGSYYLASGCSFFNAGTTNISLTLLANLRTRTTHPPLICSNSTFPVNTILSPQAQRDTDSSPDLGYHYDPLDYLCSQMSVAQYSYGTPGVTLTNGVAVGLFGTYGFALNDVACAFASVGQPNMMNRIVWCPSVQEQPVALMNTSGSAGIFNVAGASSTSIYIPKPQITLRFTDLAMLGGRQNFFCTSNIYNSAWTLNLNTVFLEDCWLRGVNLCINGGYIAYTNATTMVTLQNNLLERSTVSLFNGYVYGYVVDNPLALTACNNLFWHSNLGLTYQDSQSWIHPAWTINDNLFDTAANSLVGTGSYTNDITVSNNGFYNTATNQIGGTTNVVITSLAYATSWFGPWYIGSSSPTVLYAGSRSAASAGLYHETIQTNQIPDGTNMVSIGYHYVATDTNGIPLSTAGDGIPDYLADANGNGIVDPGEISWMNYYSLNGLANGNGLLVFTPLK